MSGPNDEAGRNPAGEQGKAHELSEDELEGIGGGTGEEPPPPPPPDDETGMGGAPLPPP